MKKLLALLIFVLSVSGCKVIDEIKKELYVKVTTISPDDQMIGQTVAALYGDVADDGGKAITEKGIVLSRNPNPTVNDTKILAGYKMFDGSSSSGMGKISVLAENLIVNTKYYYKAYCINSLGTSYGEEYSFTTKDLETPKLTTELNGSTTNSISVTGILANTDLIGTIISYGFYYSLQTGVKDTDPYVLSTSNNKYNNSLTFTVSIPSLLDGTTYYIKSFVKTARGITLGPEIAFKTLESPTRIGLRSGLQVFYLFSGNANDAGTNKFNGVVSSATLTSDRFGQPNSAYYFDGGNNTKISTNYPGVLGNNARSFSFWVKRKDLVFNGTTIFSYGNLNTWGQGINIGLGKINENPLILFDNEGSASGPFFNMIDDIWHHYVMTWDKSFGTSAVGVKIYIDGKYVQSTWSFNPTTINTIAGVNLLIGQYNPSKNDYRTFLGSIDDLGIWNRVLTDTEIQYLYQSNFRP